MINKQTKKLNIFENFLIDTNLPKFKKETEVGIENGTRDLLFLGGSGNVSNTNDFDSKMWQNRTLQSLKYKSDLIGSISSKFKFWVYKKFIYSYDEPKEYKPNYKDIADFFVSLKQSAEKLELKNNEFEFYSELIKNANKLGQVALVEKLMQEEERVVAEVSMIKEKQTTYIPEEYVVNYYEKAKFSKFLHLNWIKNYTRIIPTEVIELKERCDKFGWFDNYVILHFDRDGKSAEMTNEEKKKAKDPILFGVMKNSRNLYFVADWEDEYCDLTLDKMLKVLGKKSLIINNKSVKSSLNNLQK